MDKQNITLSIRLADNSRFTDLDSKSMWALEYTNYYTPNKALDRPSYLNHDCYIGINRKIDSLIINRCVSGNGFGINTYTDWELTKDGQLINMIVNTHLNKKRDEYVLLCQYHHNTKNPKSRLLKKLYINTSNSDSDEFNSMRVNEFINSFIDMTAD